jgi:oligoribonuclease NrnB/cAMP/cGMP phosphodiesterase (DHH superfamily)
MKSALFSHRRDTDGLMSAAIYLRADPESDVNFIDYGEENLREFLDKVLALKGSVSRIVVADFGLDDSYLEPVASTLKQVVDSNVEVVWLDHHDWSPEALESIRKVGVRLTKVADKEACGAELVFKTFRPGDTFSSTLALIAHRTDFHLESDDVSKTIVDVVDHYNSLDRHECDKKMEAFARRIASGIFVDQEVYTDYLSYKEREHEAIEDLHKNILFFETNGFRVAVGFPKEPLSSTKTCDIIRENTKSDIQVSIRKSKISFRRSNEKVDCAAIARMFNGGGHDYAAGGELEFEVTDKESRNRALEMLRHKIDLFTSKIP